MLALLLAASPAAPAAPVKPTLDALASAWLAAQADADRAALRAREAHRVLLAAIEAGDGR